MAETSQLTDVLSQKAITEIHHSAVRYLQLMRRQDRFDNLSELSRTLNKLDEASSKGNRQSWLASWKVLLEQDPKSYAFAHSLTQLGFLGRDRSSVNPAGYYFVNEQLKTVYCSIPKNACTLFKTMLVDNSKFKSEFEASGTGVHEFSNQRLQVSSAAYLLECLSSKEYFKFVILRNPFDRIVSGYLDKFAKHVIPEAFVQNIILDVQTSLGLVPDIEKSITFSQFVDYLATTPDNQLNDHWRPQNNFVSTVNFDFVGQFEFMDDIIKTLESTCKRSH